jgi:hypothetical protein
MQPPHRQRVGGQASVPHGVVGRVLGVEFVVFYQLVVRLFGKEQGRQVQRIDHGFGKKCPFEAGFPEQGQVVAEDVVPAHAGGLAGKGAEFGGEVR